VPPSRPEKPLAPSGLRDRRRQFKIPHFSEFSNMERAAKAIKAAMP
jgi:hypothetical protein